MIYQVYFYPDIENDLIEITRYYEEKVIGLAEEFLQIFYSSCDMISKHPFQCSKIYGTFRRYLLRKFPYVIYYLIMDNRVVIFGLFHHSRSPETINKTLNERK